MIWLACILQGKVCDSDVLRYACLFTLLCVLCGFLFVWIFIRDPCFQWEIQQSLVSIAPLQLDLFSFAYYSFNKSFNQYKPGVLFLGHRLTV